MAAWTTFMDADLRKLWGEGKSTAKIGVAMGLSKNSVVGRAHRLKLPARESPITRTISPRAAQPVGKAATLPPLAVVAGKRSLSSDLGSRPAVKKTLEVEEVAPQPFVRPATRTDKRGCQWPIGEPRTPGFRFCEAPEVVFGRAYCPEHQAASSVTPGHVPYGYARTPKGWAA